MDDPNYTNISLGARLVCPKYSYGKEAIPPEKLDRLILLYSTIVDRGIEYHEAQPKLVKANGKTTRAKRAGHNLLLRLKEYCGAVLRFLTDPNVPFTNNLAEQDIRMMKGKQKVTGGFKTHVGAEQFAKLRGFISTARKQQWNILESISSAIKGNAPLPN